ncbi:MAG TPA: PhoU domain-containing protein [Phycisphaerales bacterium]|nr:PhoU domain-containing protein [Phycisphaerales bacterium]
MPNSTDHFAIQVNKLKGELVGQGRRVQALMEASFEAVFTRDLTAAKKVVAMDEEIDRVDVALEKSAVALLTEATGLGSRLEASQLRWVLMIVKVNNELERIADVGVAIAEECRLFHHASDLPPTFRVMANSVVGIIRDCVSSLDRLDPELARVVLLSEEAVLAFKKALVAETQKKLKAGTLDVDVCSALHDVAMQCVTSADHCTNIAEQVMYTATGKIVRHMEGHWEEVKLDEGRDGKRDA